VIRFDVAVTVETLDESNDIGTKECVEGVIMSVVEILRKSVPKVERKLCYLKVKRRRNEVENKFFNLYPS
jgi:hypothetical protein